MDCQFDTGFAALRGAVDAVQLLFYMREATRKRWQAGWQRMHGTERERSASGHAQTNVQV